MACPDTDQWSGTRPAIVGTGRVIGEGVLTTRQSTYRNSFELNSACAKLLNEFDRR
jgi:hypothetical protein